MSGPVLAVDLGGTHIRAAVTDAAGGVSRREERDTPHDGTGLDALTRVARGVLAGTDVERAVVGVPGRVDYDEGVLEYAPNLPQGWLAGLTERHLAGALGIPVRLANDADLAAVGETNFGAGRGHGDVVYVTLSTGLGAGVVLRGRLARGRHSLAEIGHTVLDLTALGAGLPATAEDLASGTALSRHAGIAGVPATSGSDVLRLVEDGDVDAARVWTAFTEAAGVAVANLVHLFSPEIVVVGGGVGLIGNAVLAPLRDALARLGPPRLRVDVVPAALGDDAGLAGATAWEDALG